MKRLTLLLSVFLISTIFGFSQKHTKANKEVKQYVNENVLPVIAKERLNFDKTLSDDEKKIIETARQKIEVRKIMFKNWHESEDFEAGKRAKDPNFEGMRTDMKNSMEKVREIAITHNEEIRECIGEIKKHSDSWREEISIISERNNQDPVKTNRMLRQKMHKSQTPIAFLLFNPANAEESDLFGFNKDSELKVIIYPNPVYENATIAIINAADKNVKVTLTTKDGESLKVLFDGQNQKLRLEVMLNVSELKNDFYLVEILTENKKIVRKIIIKH